jgi:predicted amidohydrolase YtcJ
MKKVFYNGKIITIDPACPQAEALVVEGNRIIDVGSSEDMLAVAHAPDQRVDLERKTVIPGLIDAHTHLFDYAMAKNWLDLNGMSSFNQTIDLIKEDVKRRGRNEWIFARGWDQNRMRGFDAAVIAELDRVSPENPVFLERVCGHAAFVNSAALAKASIDGGRPCPAGGEIKHNASGKPTGLLIDKAVDIVRAVFPDTAPGREKELVAESINDCLSVGITGVHDMSVSGKTLSVYRELAEEDKFPFRLAGYYSCDKIDFNNIGDTDFLTYDFAEYITVPGVKFFLDGSLGARSAALLEDYSDDPGNRGILVESPASLFERILLCNRAGLQVAVHAIGDRANRIVLDIFEEVMSDFPIAGRRHRIEHAQLVDPEDIPRFSKLELIPSMQFVHCVSDMLWIKSRLGRRGLKIAYPWKSLLSSGCGIAGGSDMPVESVNPFLGIYSAVTRQSPDGMPPGGWGADQRLTPIEALESFTINAAYASFREDSLGSLKRGKLADFVIISDDSLEIPAEKIPELRVLGTVQDGNIVYTPDDSPF